MCNCIELSNAELAKHNTELDMPFYLYPQEPKRVTIATRKIDKKKREGPIRIVGAYCPFCGKEIQKGGNMKRNESGEMLVEFLFGLFIFGGVAIACFPLGVVALGLAAFATIFYAVVLNKVQRHQSAHLYDDQAEFVQKQRTSNAGILARSRRDRPYDKRFRREFICEQPSVWHPRYEDLADAVDKAQKEPRIYHERQTSGKWRPTHTPRDYSDKNGG